VPAKALFETTSWRFFLQRGRKFASICAVQQSALSLWKSAMQSTVDEDSGKSALNIMLRFDAPISGGLGSSGYELDG
jgi:hypothetical protein